MVTLRVMTYNVCDFTADRSAAARVVRAVDPDVLCLQEVPRRLTTELRLPGFARECGMLWAGGRLGTGGCAVLTHHRVRVLGTRRGRLPVRFPDRSRGYAAVDVAIPGAEPLTVASLHLGLKAGERAAHVERVLAELPSRSIIAGDLNEVHGMARDLLLSTFRLGTAQVPTFPADRPAQALDVVLVGAGLQVLEVLGPVRRAPVEEDLAAASDHRPVWVDVNLAPVRGSDRQPRT